MALLATGRMFQLDLDDESRVALVRVWKRPELSRHEGVLNAAELTEAVTTLAIAGAQAAGIVLDVREAPVPGPLTQQSIEKLMENSEQAGKRIAVLVSDDPLYMLPMRRIVGTGAPSQGRVFGDLDAARAWARGA